MQRASCRVTSPPVAAARRTPVGCHATRPPPGEGGAIASVIGDARNVIPCKRAFPTRPVGSQPPTPTAHKGRDAAFTDCQRSRNLPVPRDGWCARCLPITWRSPLRHMGVLRCGHAFGPATSQRLPPTDVSMPRVRIATHRPGRRRRRRQLPLRGMRALLARRARTREPDQPAPAVVTAPTPNDTSAQPAPPGPELRPRSRLSSAVLAKADLDRSLLENGLLAVSCWCERHVVAVSRTEVQRGRTASCGHCRCRPPRPRRSSLREN